MDLGTAIVVSTGILALAVVVFAIIKKTGDATEKTIEQGAGTVNNAINKTSEAVRPASEGIGDVLKSIADRIRTKSEKMRKLQTECINLTNEVERLKSQKVEVSSVKAILMLALAEMDCSYTDFKKKILERRDGNFVARNEDIEYLGVMTVTYKQRIGVDFEKLRFRFKGGGHGDGIILVAGLDELTVIGKNEIKMDTKFAEVRRHLTGGPAPDSHEILVDHDKSGPMEEQRKEVEKRVNSDTELQKMGVQMEEISLKVLNAFCSHSGHTFEIGKVEPDEALSLDEVFRQINGSLDDSIAKKVGARKMLEEQLESVRGEVLSSVEQEEKKYGCRSVMNQEY